MAAGHRVFQAGPARPAGIDYKKDHYLADNMRYYMDRAGDNAGLDRMFPELIAAYPDTYDYYFRYGRTVW